MLNSFISALYHEDVPYTETSVAIYTIP